MVGSWYVHICDAVLLCGGGMIHSSCCCLAERFQVKSIHREQTTYWFFVIFGFSFSFQEPPRQYSFLGSNGARSLSFTCTLQQQYTLYTSKHIIYMRHIYNTAASKYIRILLLLYYPAVLRMMLVLYHTAVTSQYSP